MLDGAPPALERVISPASDFWTLSDCRVLLLASLHTPADRRAAERRGPRVPRRAVRPCGGRGAETSRRTRDGARLATWRLCTATNSSIPRCSGTRTGSGRVQGGQGDDAAARPAGRPSEGTAGRREPIRPRLRGLRPGPRAREPRPARVFTSPKALEERLAFALRVDLLIALCVVQGVQGVQGVARVRFRSPDDDSPFGL